MPDINASYNWAVNTCNAPDVGYSWTYRDQQTVGRITYYDCSSFIWYALLAGGFDCVAANGGNSYPFVTWTMESVLQRLGFVSVPLTGEILPGDIGFYDYVVNGQHDGHTEMYYQGGQGTGISMGAHTSSVPLANQVSINSYQSPGTRWQKIYRYGGGASGVSVSLYVIAAICGNFWAESNVNPGIYEGLNVVPLTDNSVYGGYGLGQWTNMPPSLTRRTQLANWLSENGYAMDSGDGQLSYLIHEDYWTPGSIEQSAYQTLEEFLQSTSTDIPQLTKEYMFHWEGINNGTLTTRQANAATVYDYLVEHFSDPDITTWVVGNRYLSNSELLNNCVLVARFLSNGIIPVKKKTWIYLYRHIIRKKRRERD